MARTTNITRYTCDRCHASAYLADGDPRTSSDWHDITHTTVDGVAQGALVLYNQKVHSCLLNEQVVSYYSRAG